MRRHLLRHMTHLNRGVHLNRWTDRKMRYGPDRADIPNIDGSAGAGTVSPFPVSGEVALLVGTPKKCFGPGLTRRSADVRPQSPQASHPLNSAGSAKQMLNIVQHFGTGNRAGHATV